MANAGSIVDFSTPTEILPRRRSGAITAMVVLLIIQAAGFLSLAAWQLSRVDPLWYRHPETYMSELSSGIRSPAFLGLALLSVIAAFSFARLWLPAWMTANLVQGLALSLCLFLYFTDRVFYLYILMPYCILMVLFLNTSDVRTFFQPKTETLQPVDENEL